VTTLPANGYNRVSIENRRRYGIRARMLFILNVRKMANRNMNETINMDREMDKYTNRNSNTPYNPYLMAGNTLMNKVNIMYPKNMYFKPLIDFSKSLSEGIADSEIVRAIYGRIQNNMSDTRLFNHSVGNRVRQFHIISKGANRGVSSSIYIRVFNCDQTSPPRGFQKNDTIVRNNISEPKNNGAVDIRASFIGLPVYSLFTHPYSIMFPLLLIAKGRNS